MTSDAIKYSTDREGHPVAVIIPISLWRAIFPESITSVEDLTERIEDYCLGRAMDEAAKTPSLDREAALTFLEEDSD